MLAEYTEQNHIRFPESYYGSLVRDVEPIFTDPVWPKGRLGGFLTGKVGLPERHFDPHDVGPPPMHWPFQDYMFYAASQALDPTARQAELREVLKVKLAAILELQPDVREISPGDLTTLSAEAQVILPFRDKLLGHYDSLFKLTPHKKPRGETEYVYWEQDRTHAIENLFILSECFPSPEHALSLLQQMKARDAFPKNHHMNFDNWLRIAIESHSQSQT